LWLPREWSAPPRRFRLYIDSFLQDALAPHKHKHGHKQISQVGDTRRGTVRRGEARQGEARLGEAGRGDTQATTTQRQRYEHPHFVCISQSIPTTTYRYILQTTRLHPQRHSILHAITHCACCHVPLHTTTCCHMLSPTTTYRRIASNSVTCCRIPLHKVT